MSNSRNKLINKLNRRTIGKSVEEWLNEKKILDAEYISCYNSSTGESYDSIISQEITWDDYQ